SLIAEIDVVEIRNAFDVSAGIFRRARVEFTERDQILRILKWERSQQDRVDHAEDCGVGTNAERESQNDDRSEERLFGQNTKCITEILHGILFGPQSDDWIDPRGAARRNPRCEQCRSKKEQTDAQINSWIDPLHVKEHAL